MNANGTGATVLTNNTADDVYPDFSPDGTKIVFANKGLRPGSTRSTSNGTGLTQPDDEPRTTTSRGSRPTGTRSRSLADSALYGDEAGRQRAEPGSGSSEARRASPGTGRRPPP